MNSKLDSSVMLIVPCYNEAQRLRFADFRHATEQGIQLCFANDGSKDNTGELLKREFGQNDRVLIFEAPKNSGKANVIRQAAMYLQETGEITKRQIRWVGFWDADLATPISEVEFFLSYQQKFAPDAVAIFGSRVLRLGAKIERSPKRHYLGRIFATLAAILLRIRSYDSQCGAKLFRSDILSKTFKEEFVSKWIFDVEILLRIGEEGTIEVPVQRWLDVPGSKVKISREAFRVLMDLWKIRKKYNR